MTKESTTEAGFVRGMMIRYSAVVCIIEIKVNKSVW